jgi:hypothetical protein
MATIEITDVPANLHACLIEGASRSQTSLEKYVVDLLLACVPISKKPRDLTEILNSIPRSDVPTSEIVAAVRAHRDCTL